MDHYAPAGDGARNAAPGKKNHMAVLCWSTLCPASASLLLLLACAAGLLPEVLPVPGLDPSLTSFYSPPFLSLSHSSSWTPSWALYWFSAPSALQEGSAPALDCGTSIALAMGRDAEPGCGATALGLEVQGAGARGCTVGELCSFTVRVSEPATWPYNASQAFNWDPTVTLAGPALVHTSVAAVPAPLISPPIRTQAFAMTYTAWDPGVYQASLVDRCGSLKLPGVYFPVFQNRTGLSLVASWHLVVHPRQSLRTPPSEQAQGSAVVQPVAGMPRSAPVTDPSPCLQAIPARWLRTLTQQELQTAPSSGEGEARGGRGEEGKQEDTVRLWENEYGWVPYGCTQWLTPAQVAQALVRHNIREVAFIGDSHVRFLMWHSAFLLLGEPMLNATFKMHDQFSFPVALKTGAPSGQESLGKTSGRSSRRHVVHFSFYWIDGIYRNEEYGCINRGLFSHRQVEFPSLTSRPDLAVLDGGYWAASYCAHAGMAVARRLDQFLSFYADQLAKMNGNKPMNASQVTFMGLVPRSYCSPVRTVYSRLLQYESKLTQVYATSHGFSFFDPWTIANPMMQCTLRADDPHFSWMEFTNVTGDWRVKMKGVVGEAMARTFLEHMANQLG